MSFALETYHRLPSWAKTVVASTRGYALRNRRYDENTDRIVEETLARDFWTPEQWDQWQEERLAEFLDRARRTVPFYSDFWDRESLSGSGHLDLSNWPVLEKSVLRDTPKALVSNECSIDQMVHENTSGTTGASLNLWLTQSTIKKWYGIFEARCREWYGISRHDNWANIGGQLVTPFSRQKPPFWVWNSGLNQLYMSAFHISRDSVKSYVDALTSHRIKYMLGYSSALCSIAEGILANGIKPPKLDVVITNAEPLYDYQRERMEAAFECPVRETYGMAEIVAAASECEKGSLHTWPDAGIIEVDSSTINEEGSGELICTGLVNIDMALVRYRNGDRATLSDRSCECGRTLPLIESIDGRTDDILFTATGREVSHVHNLAPNGDLGVYESQIIQETTDRLRFRYVPNDEFSDRKQSLILKNLRSRMGAVSVVFEAVEKLPRTRNGKIRTIICELSAEEKAELKSLSQ